MDEEEGEEDVRISDAVAGRGTFFCCLCCGVPFSFPDDAYLSKKQAARNIIHFTHYVRKEMRVDDRSRASTSQWALNRCHYIHSFLHPSVQKSSSFSDSHNQDGNNNRARQWADQDLFLKHANKLIGCLKFSASDLKTTKPPMTMDDEFLNYMSPWCNGCNTAATNDRFLKKMLGMTGVGNSRKPLRGVPDASSLPLGMRMLHDVYLFLYMMAACISSMLSASCIEPDLSPAKCFRLDCLVRLYVGYMLYQLMERLNARSVVGDLSFEHWYMLYFNDLQLWERLYSSEEDKQPYTALLARLGPRSDESNHLPPMHNFSSSTGIPKFGDSLMLPDILERITLLAIQHWYALDIYNLSKRDSQEMSKKHKDYHDWLPWKKFIRMDQLKSFLSRASASLAPAPFCCIPDDEYFVGRQEDDENGNQPHYIQGILPREMFFRSLFLNTSVHFCRRANLHKKMKAFLPALFQEVRVLEPNSDPPIIIEDDEIIQEEEEEQQQMQRQYDLRPRPPQRRYNLRRDRRPL